MASRSWNRIELIGNLTRDPELRFIPSGTAVATFGLATNRTYVSDGERREEVDFHKIVAWGKLAELCNQLLKKGARVFISGRLQYRDWETQDGQKRRDAEIVLEDMILITPKNGSVSSNEEIPEEAKPEDSPVAEKASSEEPKLKAQAEDQDVQKNKDAAKPKVEENVDLEGSDLPF